MPISQEFFKPRRLSDHELEEEMRLIVADRSGSPRKDEACPIEDFLELLDPRFATSRDFRRGLGRSAGIPFQAEGIRRLQAQLTAFVDLWIDSGICADGSERPLDRRLNLDSSIMKAADAYWTKYPPQPWIRDDGFIEYRPRPTSRKPSAISAGIGKRDGLSEMFTEKECEEEAAGLFLHFLCNSEWRFRLMKCRRCGVYMSAKSPRETYVRGWHCARCRKIAPAMLAVQKTRAERKARWFPLAVEAWGKTERFRGERVVKVAELVNASLQKASGRRNLDPIRRNTISRHLEAIKAAAARKS